MAFLVIAAITALSNGHRQKGNVEKASTKTIATAKPTAYVTAAPTKIKKATATPVSNYASMPPLTAVSTAAKQAIEDRPAFTCKSCKKEGGFFDEYANRVSVQVFQIIISEETMQKINYENMGNKVLNNPDALLNISDGWFIEAHFMDYKNEK